MTRASQRYLLRLTSILTALALLHCGASAEDSSFSSPSGGPTYDAGASKGGSSQGGAAGAAGSSLPPEKELESSYRSPVATGQYVWIANPTSGQVAYVDATSLEVRTVPAGNGPTYMAAVPTAADDVALTINVLSIDATILRQKVGSGLQAKNVPIHVDANSWAVSPKGRWAIAWSDYRVADKPDPVQGFQDVTVLDLTEGAETTTRLAVGFRPVTVSYSSDDSTAFAVSQDGISVIDLAGAGGPTSAKLVEISDNPLEDSGSRDVAITPDGAYALVRRDSSNAITVVTLADGTLTEVLLPGNCTDLDLSPDGTRAVAVVRDLNQVAILPIPAIVAAPETFELTTVDKATVGSVSMASEAALALLYTNAKAEDRITVLSFDASPAQVHTIKLHAPVLAAFLSASGTSSIVVHQPVSGAEGAFSALSIQPELPGKIITAHAPITAVAITPDGSRSILAESKAQGKVYGAYMVRGSTQQVDRYELSSPPIAVGVVLTAQRAFIAQEHPEGRLTFIDLDTGLARTLTGFELAARVVDGSKP